MTDNDFTPTPHDDEPERGDVGGLVTDEGGRPLTDDGGRPLVRDAQ